MIGGPGERVYATWEHACRAHKLLAVYEAAVSRDMEKLRQVFDPETGSWSTGPGLMPLLADELGLDNPEGPTTSEDEQQRSLRDLRDLQYVCSNVRLDDARNAEYLAAIAIRIVIDRVQGTLAPLAQPSFATMAPPSEGKPGRWWDPDLLTHSWVPVNLLGAIYLQFYWLMASRGELSRCEHCGNIISDARSIARDGRARKPRRDRDFCDSRYRQNYHYHNRIKPARQGNNESGGRPQP